MRLNPAILRPLALALLFWGIVDSLQAQSGVGANFGIEAECYSGDAVSGAGTDDWFYGGTSGAGVIDEATAASMGYAAQLAANQNISFDLRQSLPNYATNNGYIWYSARYARDYVTYLLSSPDQNIFSSGKNAQNPETSWFTTSGDVSDKTDIVDAAIHMRRDGTDITDDLWVDMFISTLSADGNHFVDFELFVSEIQNDGTGFINSGSQEGHTAWEFDADGNVTQIGDMIVGFAFDGEGVSTVEVRLWVARTTFFAGTSPGGTSNFTWGALIDGPDFSSYGYAQIVVPPAAILSNVNPLNSPAPPWGTTNLSGYSNNFDNNHLAEVGLNFTALGFDPRALFGSSAACDSPFSAVLPKSRSSSSFTSALKDFIGPLDFLGTASDTQVNTRIADPGTFDSCATGETRTLQAEFISSSAVYTWYALTPGEVFPANGLDMISGVALDAVIIDSPGEYQLGIAPLEGCDPYLDNDKILGVWSSPCARENSYHTIKDQTLDVPAPGLLGNDTDLEPADVLTVSITPIVNPAHGTLTLNAIGSFSYTPNPGSTESDSFTYEVCDSHGLCDTAVVNLLMTSGIPRVVTNRRITYRVNN